MFSSVFLATALGFYAPVAAQLTETDVFARCSARLLRQVPKRTDPLFQDVQAGRKSGADACIALFDRGRLGSNGRLLTENDPQSRRVLKTFNDLHRTWFQSKSFEGVVGGATNNLMHDVEEPALYFTRAAMTTNGEFKSIVTLGTGLKGVRALPTAAQGLSKRLTHIGLNYGSTFPYANDPRLLIASMFYEKRPNDAGFIRLGTRTNIADDAVITDTGELIGVAAPPPFVIPAFHAGFTTSGDFLKAANILFGNTTVNGHFGGGIIGSQGFILQNTNLNNGQIPTDVSVINRRLTTRVFEDLMCHEMPTLTDADVQAETATYVKNKSPHTFQLASSCMRCHSSVDGMGYAMRNLVKYQTAANPNLGIQEYGLNFTGVLQLPVIANTTAFALQPPHGRLHYREVLTRARKDFQVTSLSQMGTLISQQSDIYYCAAKRYYHFFTGINVNLNAAPENDVDRLHQEQVRTLGNGLKASQSVRTMIHAIFKTKAFREWNYLSAVEAK